MPRTRHATTVSEESRLVVRSLAVRYPARHRTGEHAHDWGQLVYATEGVVVVHTRDGRWIVPPERAVWVPAAVLHELETVGPVALRTLYLRPDLLDGLPAAGFVFGVSPLLRELILRIVTLQMLDDRDPSQLRLARVVVDQIDPLAEQPLSRPLPRDERGRRVAMRLLAEPGAAASLADLVDGVGASARTIERIFVRETGLTFQKWRQRVRVLHGMELLASGANVTQVAIDLGYDSTSAFIAMFRREIGTTPGRYFDG